MDNRGDNSKQHNETRDGFYVGKWPDCGCFTAVCVDDHKDKKFTSGFVARLIKDGLSVERRDNLDGIKFQRCPHHLRRLSKDRGL